MAGYWLKLYTEVLNDPKYHKLSDNAKVGMFELMLVAKEFDKDGLLPSIEDIAFYTRRSVDWWVPVSDELTAIKFLVVDRELNASIRKFAERQAFVSATERSRQYRAAKHKNEFMQRDCNEDATISDGEQTRQETEEETEEETDNRKKSVVVDKSKAASALRARELSTETIQELLPLRSQDELLAYCAAYDQAIKDNKATNSGWLIKAIREKWNIGYLVKKAKETRPRMETGQERRTYINGPLAEFVKH